MIKILIAVNPLHPGRHALDFGAYIARSSGSGLTAVFLENKQVLTGADMPQVMRVSGTETESYDTESLIAKHIDDFSRACSAREVTAYIHRDRQQPVTELINESRFADLLIMDPTLSFNAGQEGSVSGITRQLLQHAECPVLLASGQIPAIDEIIVFYDGERNCMHSIKQFIYLLPQFSVKKLTVMMTLDPDINFGKHLYHFKEWVGNHFTAVQFEYLKSGADKRLPELMLEKSNCLIVMGAYGRSSVSRFFRESHADIIIRSVSHAIFISHH